MAAAVAAAFAQPIHLCPPPLFIPGADGAPYMNMAAAAAGASPAYTLAIHLPPAGAMPEAFQQQLSSSLDVPHPGPISGGGMPPMPMPGLSTGGVRWRQARCLGPMPMPALSRAAVLRGLRERMRGAGVCTCEWACTRGATGWRPMCVLRGLQG